MIKGYLYEVIKDMTKKSIIKKTIIISMTMVIMAGMTGCESWKRFKKGIHSDVNGGLNREVKVYSYDGKLIHTYKGKFDIQSNENKVLFDIKGKRVTIYNSPVVVEER